MLFVRYGIPLTFVVAGIVLLFAADRSVATVAWAGFTGAGISVLLLNILFRIGVAGEEERDRTDEAARPSPPPHREAPDSRRRAARPPRRG
jgi:hypothetical protein